MVIAIIIAIPAIPFFILSSLFSEDKPVKPLFW